MFGLAVAGSESNVDAFAALIFRINWHHFKKFNLTLHFPTLLQYPKISSPTRSAGPRVCFVRLCVWGVREAAGRTRRAAWALALQATG